MQDWKVQEMNNEIAKVLGWEKEDNSWYSNNGISRFVVFSEYHNYPFRGLTFHCDWNYLMKAIKHISGLSKKTGLSKQQILALGKLHSCSVTDNIENVFSVVHECAQVFNKTN